MTPATACAAPPRDQLAPERVRPREYAIVGVAAAVFLYLVNFRGGTFIYTLSQQEGGIWIDEAVRTLQGELIYRDFFDFLAPGVTYLNAAFLALLGPTTTAVGVMIVSVGVLGALALHALAATMLPLIWRTAATAIFVGLTYPAYSPGNHKWPAVILCLAALLAVARRRSRLRCALSGVAIGGVGLCTQDFGAAAAIGLAAALWLLRARDPASDPIAFMVACGLTVAAVLGGLALAAGFAAVWYAVVVFPLAQYPQVGFSFAVGLGSAGLRNLPLAFAAFGLAGLGLMYAASGAMRRFWRSDPAPVVLVAATGAALLLLGGLSRQLEPTLFAVRATPMTLIGLYALRRWLSVAPRRTELGAGLLMIAASLAIYALARPAIRQFGQAWHRAEHRAGAIWVQDRIADLDWLEANTTQDQKVFLFPDKGGLYFLSRTRNATSYPMLLDQGFYTEAQVADAIRQIAKACPAVGIWDRTRLTSFADNRPDWFTLAPLYRALLQDYEVAAELPNGAFALRRKTACGGR